MRPIAPWFSAFTRPMPIAITPRREHGPDAHRDHAAARARARCPSLRPPRNPSSGAPRNTQRLDPTEQTEHATFAQRIVYVPDGGTKAYDDKADVIDALLTGVMSRKVIRYAYVDARGRRQRGHLAPFAMAIHKHGLYVVARRLKRPEDGAQLTSAREVSTFAVERFAEAEHLRAFAFTTPADFDLNAIMHDAFGVHLPTSEEPTRVVVEFSKERATYARARVWHKTQQVRELPDGRLRVEFDTRAPLAPIVSWVLSWGPHALPIEPPALVAQVVAELDAARAAINLRSSRPEPR